jgi:hypothetical protein
MFVTFLFQHNLLKLPFLPFLVNQPLPSIISCTYASLPKSLVGIKPPKQNQPPTRKKKTHQQVYNSRHNPPSVIKTVPFPPQNPHLVPHLCTLRSIPNSLLFFVRNNKCPFETCPLRSQYSAVGSRSFSLYISESSACCIWGKPGGSYVDIGESKVGDGGGASQRGQPICI